VTDPDPKTPSAVNVSPGSAWRQFNDLLRMPLPPRLGLIPFVLPALALGLIVRAVPVLTSDFPLHDGGLFVAMVHDVIRAGFALPQFTSYNQDQIPFAYPPLAIYLAAALSQAGLDLIALMRLLPILFSLATIPLVYAVTRELTGRIGLAAVAAIAFALAPRSYEWLVIGGGLTRAPGFVLALAAVWLAIKLTKHASIQIAAAMGLAGGLTALTHPEAALFLAVSVALLLVVRARSLRVVGYFLGAALLGLVVAAPWWVSVLQVHGWTVFLGAAGSRSALLINALRDLLFGQFTGAEAFDVFLGVGFVGVLAEVGRGRYLYVVWLLGLTLTIVGAGFTYAMVPWSVLIAIGVLDVIVPGMDRLSRGHRYARPVLVSGLVGASVLASLATGYSVTAPIHDLSPAERVAMAWVSQQLPTGAKVVVVTGLAWWNDASAEWFPVLADRQSVATVQGYEWTHNFAGREERNRVLQTQCARETVTCLEAWVRQSSLKVDYVYIPKGHLAGLASLSDCCAALRETVRSDLQVVYDGPGATIAALGP
jgi:hypothetical protein